MRPIVCLTIFVCVIFASACSSAPEGSVTIEVAAGEHDRDSCPVTVDLPPALADAANFALARADSGAVVPIQKIPGEPARAVFLLDEPLASGESRRYHLSAADTPAWTDPAAKAVDGRGTTTVTVGDKPVLVYNRSVLEPPEGVDPVFRASGFIHPLYTPSGKIVTDDYPPDHYHQNGVFFAWVNATFEGRQVDFWNRAKKLGGTEHFTIQYIVSGDVFAGFSVVRRYLDPNAPEGPKPAIEETWNVRVYNSSAPFVIDLDSEQRTAGPSPLVLNEYRYGGFAIRGSREWFEQPESDFLTSEGKMREEGNHTRPLWVEMHGLSDGAPAGVIVMGSPDNFRHPQPVRLHPSKPYFCFSPMVEGEFQIKPGELYHSRYRIVTHDGAPDPETNNRLRADYAAPPAVRVID